ncbi:MAG: type I restriction enzyme HsdR N-terminal domain-containing protein [Bacteroidia bacterium]|jgi:hypothetical protein|nr:type I restriction enzyme HsdR N-terminal domain-containing protein [Bacteroidia bacterium]
MQLIFPSYKFNIKQDKNRSCIFDIIRKKFVVLTPEEWVRQHLVRYLIDTCGCAASLIAIEKGLIINGLQKRFDVLVFNNLGKPILLAECKSPDVSLSNETFRQAAIYNQSLQVPHLLITNGVELLFCTYAENYTDYTIAAKIPNYPFST